MQFNHFQVQLYPRDCLLIIEEQRPYNGGSTKNDQRNFHIIFVAQIFPTNNNFSEIALNRFFPQPFPWFLSMLSKILKFE